MAETPAIEVKDLKKSYRSGLIFRKSFEALRGVTLEVQRGEIFGLLGPNGAGKTTLVKTLLGIIRKSAGTASMLGLPVGSRAARELVGYLPENLRMPNHLNALTALEYYGSLSNLPPAEIKRKRDDLLKLVGLADRAKDSVRKYSKGMRQRLGLAQALMHDPQLLILDEPTDGLDPVARSQVRDILTRLQREQGVTIFLNSHILQEVELICQRVAILDRGLLRYVGSVKDIHSQRQVEALQEKKKAALVESTAVTTALSLDLELEGDEAAIREVLAQRTMKNWEPLGEGQFRLTVEMPDQAAVDQLIDRLRSSGVNIVGLSRRRVTLEDAFLEILAEPAE